MRVTPHDVLKRNLERLSAAQTDILSKRFYHRKTPREFSTETGIPPERVRQREAQTLRALRCPQISRKLREYLEEERTIIFVWAYLRQQCHGNISMRRELMIRRFRGS